VNVRSWWVALPPAQQAQQKNIDAMVSNTEGILRSEFSSWVQEMQEAMTELKKQQTPKEDDKEAANSSSQSIQTTVTNSTISVESSVETVASSSNTPPNVPPAP
jgi:truncated hemoglobin YjbI